MSGVAVVIVCHDLGRTLDEALSSVSSQTLPADEIVVVDDGSTDVYTRQVLARLEAPRTRVILAPHRGVAAARDLGIRSTSAPLVLLLDADDTIDPTYLEKGMARLEADPSLDFVACAIAAFGDASYVWTPPPADRFDLHLTHGSYLITTLLRRELWDTVGGCDPELPAHEDWDFWLRVVARGSRGTVIDEPLLHYRIRPGSRNVVGFERERYASTMRRILEKHRATIERLGPEILIEKASYLRFQEESRTLLNGRRLELEAELTRVGREIGEMKEALVAAGVTPVDWGDLGRTAPFSTFWGVERGKPIDRVYIERFLESHRLDIRGRVLEVKDSGYTRRFGDERVTRTDTLDIDPTNDGATIVADLRNATAIPDSSFDCFIVTQTLHFADDVRAALAEAHRILKPGGVLLATFPHISPIDPEYGGIERGGYWRFTEASLRMLFADLFPPEAFEVAGFGNTKTSVAFLLGLAAEELLPADFEPFDPWCPLGFAVRAVRRDGAT